ncbi:MAG: ATP-binding cassette domain-containing protein [Bacteroidota bacterium]
MIKFENVSLRSADRFILRSLSLEIGEGERVIFAGRSGIGKTSVFRLLLGFSTPSEGSIYFRGRHLDNKTLWQFRQSSAYVSQDLNIGTGSVQQLLDTIFSFHVNSRIEYKNELAGLLEYFELPSDVNVRMISELSGGEKQRVAVIIALLLRRKIYLLDEITSALDEKMKKKTIDYIFSRPGNTILYISHDTYMPEDAGIRIVNLEDYQ